jgi:hypothetical protein
MSLDSSLWTISPPHKKVEEPHERVALSLSYADPFSIVVISVLKQQKTCEFFP